MKRPARVTGWIVVGIIVVAALGWAGVAGYRHFVYGAVFTEDALSVTVDSGDRFSLAVPDRGGSVGDSWSARADTTGILDGQGHRKRNDSLFEPAPGGGQGTSFFVFEARRAGTTEVELSNCFQGCDQPTPSPESRTIKWTITVR